MKSPRTECPAPRVHPSLSLAAEELARITAAECATVPHHNSRVPRDNRCLQRNQTNVALPPIFAFTWGQAAISACTEAFRSRYRGGPQLLCLRRWATHNPAFQPTRSGLRPPRAAELRR